MARSASIWILCFGTWTKSGAKCMWWGSERYCHWEHRIGKNRPRKWISESASNLSVGAHILTSYRFTRGASRKFKRWGHPIPPLGAPGPQSWGRDQFLEVLESGYPIYNGVLCIFIQNWKYISRRISRLRGSWGLIFHQSIVLIGTSNPENMSFQRLLQVGQPKIDFVFSKSLVNLQWNPFVF